MVDNNDEMLDNDDEMLDNDDDDDKVVEIVQDRCFIGHASIESRLESTKLDAQLIPF